MEEPQIVVTGAAGFIGSRCIRALNARGFDNVVAVDDLSDGKKFLNLVPLSLSDYMDKDTFRQCVEADSLSFSVAAIIHQGACSDTTEWNGRYMLDINFEYSKSLFRFCQTYGVPLIYASSAAVYGNSTHFAEDPRNESPINVYGFSKLLFDRWVRRQLSADGAQVVGLRYFNVYGPGEAHKGSMASVAWHFHNQLRELDQVSLFEGTDGYADGGQRRDFVHVDDVAGVVLWFLDHPELSGIFNVGTGHSATFNDVANAVVEWHGRGSLTYIPFPEHLKGHYQSFTEADLGQLHALGCDVVMRGVEAGVRDYLAELAGNNRPPSV